MSEKGLEPLANWRETLWLLARALRLRTSDRRRFLPEGDSTHTHTQFLLPPPECHTRCSDTWVDSFWCFLLADLNVGVQTAARAPLCSLFCRNSQAISGKESLADGWGHARRRPGQPDGTVGEGGEREQGYGPLQAPLFSEVAPVCKKD